MSKLINYDFKNPPKTFDSSVLRVFLKFPVWKDIKRYRVHKNCYPVLVVCQYFYDGNVRNERPPKMNYNLPFTNSYLSWDVIYYAFESIENQFKRMKVNFHNVMKIVKRNKESVKYRTYLAIVFTLNYSPIFPEILPTIAKYL